MSERSTSELRPALFPLNATFKSDVLVFVKQETGNHFSTECYNQIRRTGVCETRETGDHCFHLLTGVSERLPASKESLSDVESELDVRILSRSSLKYA